MRRNCQPNNLCIFAVNFCYSTTKFAPENSNFAANFILFQPNLLLKTHSYLISSNHSLQVDRGVILRASSPQGLGCTVKTFNWGQVRLGQARLGLARLCQGRFGQTRLGQIRIVQLTCSVVQLVICVTDFCSVGDLYNRLLFN